MNTVISQDGTRIAYERIGHGQPVILVDGALCYRGSGPSGPLAAILARDFTVYTYDRRGRGESGEGNGPYAMEREVEDLEALVREAGGSAFVYGISSGAALALEAANRVPGIRKIALYEAPFIVDDSHSPLPGDYLKRLKEMIAGNRRSKAVKFFMRRVGVPGFFVLIMPLLPVWSKLKRIAHTLVYDITIVQDFERGQPLPRDRWTSLPGPVLVADGGKSPKWMRNGMRALAEVLPGAKYQTLSGQTHMLKPEAIAPVLERFFKTAG
jgi:pimeloyl-ACP methyl ester carboxylesterase